MTIPENAVGTKLLKALIIMYGASCRAEGGEPTAKTYTESNARFKELWDYVNTRTPQPIPADVRGLVEVLESAKEHVAELEDATLCPAHPATMRGADGSCVACKERLPCPDILDPDMSAQAVRLRMGELNKDELWGVREGIRWANSRQSGKAPDVENREVVEIVVDALDRAMYETRWTNVSLARAVIKAMQQRKE